MKIPTNLPWKKIGGAAATLVMILMGAAEAYDDIQQKKKTDEMDERLSDLETKLKGEES